MRGKKAAKAVVFYELFRFFVLILSQPLKPIQFLPAAWYAAAPLLALPSALAFLIAFSRADEENASGGGAAGALKKLYVLVKTVSAVGIAVYVGTMLGASGNGSFIMAPGTRKDFFAMLFIFAADAVICLVYSRRKR